MDGSFLRGDLGSGEQVRFMTAGSVDDGKSTLIGRLLLDAGALMRDQMDGLADDGGLAAITDGLEAERAQGITIDVAYRYFSTPDAGFIIADAPGHEQYTRNMVTAASASDIAVIVVDASRVTDGGLPPQTRRHAAIAALMGLRIIIAVNKMDLLDWSQERFEMVRVAAVKLAWDLKLSEVTCVPISARQGDNVLRRGGASWWAGPTLLELIKRARRARAQADDPLRLPVQAVLRQGGKRLYAGRVESGVVAPGDRTCVGPQVRVATVARVFVGDRAVASAGPGASVAIELEEECDVARGDVIAAPGARYVRSVAADLCWLDERPLVTSRRYRLRQGALETQCLIEEIEYVIDVDDFSRGPGANLGPNDIGRVRVRTRDPILGDRYEDIPGAGAFVLFDPQTNQTCAAGMIREIPA